MHPFYVRISGKRLSFYKLLSSLLIASFLLPASALAQEAATSTNEDTTQSTATSTSDDTLLGKIISTLSDLVTGDTEKPADEKPDDGGGTNSLLSGEDGTVYDESREPKDKKPRAESDIVTGAFNYSYPIKTPPGRNGLDPNLELRYSSQDGTTDNLFGYGWSTNIPYIERINRRGVEKLYTESYFTSSLDGELLPTAVGTSTSFSAKVENSDFRTYAFINNQWTVTDKRGTTYKFGTSTGSRQDDVASSTRIYKWMLDEVRDTNNNYIKYEYYKNEGQIYPSKIIYTGNGSTDGIFETEFLRESRTDNATSTKPGFNVKTNYRINEIQAKVNGSWVRKYVLLYTTGDNGARSLLQTIRETGKDEQGNTITLPDATLAPRTSPKNWTDDSGWTIPVYFGINSNDKGVRLVDVNGDGLPDLLKAYSESGGGQTYQVYINNVDGTGWATSTSWTIPDGFHFAQSGVNKGNTTLDVNGDGLADLVKTDPGSARKTYLNTGTGWSENAAWALDFTVNIQVQFADVNGDGLEDIVRSKQSAGVGDPDIKKVYINNGNGWTEDTAWTIPVYFGINSTDLGARLADVNGDGLADILHAESVSGGGQTYKTYINKGDGTGWTEDSFWQIPTSFFFADGGTNRGNTVLDVNGDGLADLVKTDNGSTHKTYLNTGTGWTEDASWAMDMSSGSALSINVQVRLADVDGDGMVDVLWSKESAGVGDTEVKKVYINNHERADLVVQATSNLGGKTTASYKTTPLYKSGSSLLNPRLPLVLDTVQALGIDDGFGTVGTTTYSYELGEYYFASSTDRKFSGFGKILKIDPSGATTTTFYHQGNTSSTTIGEYSDHISKAGKPYRIEYASSSSSIYAKTINKWDRYDQGNGRNFVKLAQSLTQNYDGDSDHKDKAESYTWSNTNGNLTQKVEWGEVTGSDDGTFTDTGSDKFTTDISYASGGSVIGLPSTETTINQSSVKVKEARHYYDSLSLDSVTKGNETKTEGWKVSSSYASTTKSYDGTYGLVTQAKDGKGNATNYTYDTYNLFVATSTNPLSQTRAFQYDYSSGKAATTTDENSRVFVSVYDALDRVKEEKQPDLTTPTTLVTKALYTYTNTVGSRSVKKENFLGSATSTEEYTYLDGLDRVIQKRKEAEDTSTFAVSDFTYNTRGLLDKESLPYFSSGSSRTTATTTSALFTTYSYDPLQRITTVARVIGNETRAYDDWKTTITDPRSNQKSLYADAYGNLIKVDEVNGGSTYTTNYEYNYLKNLTKVDDADSNVRNFTYDGLGRRLIAQDLHASADGSYGTYTYTYDDAGNMTQKVDPKSQTVNYTYDALNRPLTEDYTGAGGTEVTYSYDSGTDGKTRLTQAVFTGSATTDYTYNPLGLTKSENKTLDSTEYLTQFEYDRQGNQTKITYPDNAEVQYAYNTAGFLESIQEKESGGSFADIVTDYDYAPTGQVTYTANANGTETTNTYDPAELYRLKTKLTKLSSCGACGGEEAPEGWVPPEFELLAEQVIAPVMDFLVSPDVTEEVKPIETAPPQLENVYERTKSAYILRKNDTTITVGDARSDDFSPKATLTRWGEASLEVSLPAAKTEANQPATFTNNKIAWNDGEKEVRFYELPESKDLPEGGYEIDVVYPKKPSSNIVTMNIASDGLNFSYQPPLNEETIPEATWCTETQCFDEKDTLIMERPENVIGSYAVYFKDGISGDYSQTRHNNYKTGKAFHIYRPRITDSAGASTWGTMNIDQGVLTITVPQDFLDSAEYPVTVDPTFGYTSVGATLATITDGIIRLSATHAAPENGTINTLHFYSGYSGSGTNCLVRPVLYKDSDLSLVTYGGENSYSTPAPGTEEWKTLDITDASLTSGTNYDLGVWVNSTSGGNACRYRYDTDASYSLKSDTYTYHATNAPADPAVIDSTLTSRRMSLYGTYTASSPATTTADILQKLIYTYDANGNITNITDNSKTGTGKIANFAYDPLNRLTSASTTVASSTPYTYSYTYSSIGNISSSTPAGSYAYAGTNYANPHAATSIGGVTHTYDNNGNLTSDGTWTHTWNYRNNLTQSTKTGATTTYAYDHQGDRVLKTEGGATTYYANKLYNTGTTTTKHIFAHGAPIVTITSAASSGIAFNATSTIIHGGFTSGPTTKNWTHTTSGSNRLLVLFADIWQDVGGTGTITSATYNGTSLTKATSTRGGGMASEIWYLANPTTGSNTLSVTITGATDSIKLAAASFTGANQSSPLDATSIASGWGGNPTASITTVTANDLVTATLSRFGTTDATTNRTSLYNSTASSTLGAASYQIATTPTSYSDTYTGSASADWSMSMAAFKPATGGGTGSTTTYYIHTDHLTGSNVLTDGSGNVAEVTDYYPYGSERIATGTFEEQRKFAGTEYDASTGLNQMGARYYAGGKGRFLSEDPVFLWLGDTERIKSSGANPSDVLSNPQFQNSYSYTANNPLRYVDKEGKFLDTVVDLVAIGYSSYKLGQAIVNGGDVKGEAGNLTLDIGSAFIPFVPAAGSLRRAAAAAEEGGQALEKARTTNNSVENINKAITEPYKRPANATTPEQKLSVQNMRCVSCGDSATKMYADHKQPLVKEYYETGKIDLSRMRSKDAVQPQCSTCSNKQGGELSNYSKEAKKALRL